MNIEQRVAHLFAGCGGSACGMERAGWRGAFVVEIDKDRCQTLRANFPGMKVYEGPIQTMTLASWPNDVARSLLHLPLYQLHERRQRPWPLAW